MNGRKTFPKTKLILAQDVVLWRNDCKCFNNIFSKIWEMWEYGNGSI